MQVPPGSLPRTIDVIMRHEAVESAKAGDKMTFHGQLVVVPDVGVISAPGERALMRSEGEAQRRGIPCMPHLHCCGHKSIHWCVIGSTLQWLPGGSVCVLLIDPCVVGLSA